MTLHRRLHLAQLPAAQTTLLLDILMSTQSSSRSKFFVTKSCDTSMEYI